MSTVVRIRIDYVQFRTPVGAFRNNEYFATFIFVPNAMIFLYEQADFFY